MSSMRARADLIRDASCCAGRRKNFHFPEMACGDAERARKCKGERCVLGCGWFVKGGIFIVLAVWLCRGMLSIMAN